jgi:hypothetical protein
MKKLYVIVFVLLFSNFLPAQQKFFSDYLKHKLNLNHQKNLTGEDILEKMNSGLWNPTNWLSQMWEGNDWLNMAYTEFYYNSNGLLTSDLNKGWGDNDWVNNTRTTYTYEGNQQTIMQSDNWENETWIPSSKSQWTYNENGRVTNIYDQNWMNDEWVNVQQTTYTYDGENCIESLMQTWNNDAWETQAKTTYEYDGEGNNTVSITEFWMMGFLINTGKDINTFDQGLKVSTLRQNLVGTDWVDASKTTYSYNENRQQTQFISEQWTGSEWVFTMNNQYTYDADGNNTEVLSQRWQDNDWVNFMKETINYEQATDVEVIELSPKNFKLFQNYPNPFNPSTVINYQLPVNSYVILKVYDILGNEIATLVNEEKPAGNYQIEFNAVNLPSGLYLYKLQTDNYSETKKMLMIK